MAFNQFNSDQELPYAVFDTSTTPNVFSGPARRITWTVNASRHSEPIRLESLPQAIQLSKSPTPWPVFYDHRIRVSVRSFATDIVNSIYGQSGYLEHLQSNAPAKVNFEKCMNESGGPYSRAAVMGPRLRGDDNKTTDPAARSPDPSASCRRRLRSR